MSQEDNDRRIDYIEFSVSDIERTKGFYSKVFGWKMTDWGDEYTSFEDGRIGGGFHKSEEPPSVSGGPLVVMFAVDLEATETAIRENGGKIVKEIFSFPGGRRFHFSDPDGYELAVWSDKE